MFSVLADGAGRYKLGNGSGANVGWIRGKTIGFRGLRNKSEAIVAASVGWKTLRTSLRREYADWPRQEVDWERLRFLNDGAHDWVSDGRIPLARVYRSGSGSAHGPSPARTLAVEFVLPSWLSEERVIPLARALWHVLAHLLGETPRATEATREASRAEWPRWPQATETEAPDELLVG